MQWIPAPLVSLCGVPWQWQILNAFRRTYHFYMCKLMSEFLCVLKEQRERERERNSSELNRTRQGTFCRTTRIISKLWSRCNMRYIWYMYVIMTMARVKGNVSNSQGVHFEKFPKEPWQNLSEDNSAAALQDCWAFERIETALLLKLKDSSL